MTAAANGIGYRPEIDGLRAVAVLAVMLFHAGFAFAAGGYLGVDIFFVISGYLITGIIFAEHTAGTFSLRHFYLRRVRRIAPALLLTMAATIPAAWFVMWPDQLENFGQSLVATTLMANNLLLEWTTGYWTQPAEMKPLMHTWSLGVEEQYYLLVPPLLLVVLRWKGTRAGAAALALAGFASLALAHAWHTQGYMTGFLMFPARLWELALGGLVAVAHRRGIRGPAPLAWAGLAMMAAGLALFGEAQAAPSLLTLLPVGGCALTILCARGEAGAARLLSWRPLVGIGLVSYSAYLFHQPVYAFIRLLSWDEPGPLALAASWPLVFLAAWASWRFVERPARDPQRMSARVLLGATGAGALAILAAGYAMHRTDGFAAHWPELRGPDGAPPIDFQAYNERIHAFRDAPLDPSRRADNVLVIGNSYARDFGNMALAAGAAGPGTLSYRSAGRCEARRIARSLEWARGVDTVVLAMMPEPGEMACFARWIARLEQAGTRHVVLLGPKQFGHATNRALLLPDAQARTARVRPMDWALDVDRAARAQLAPRNFVGFPDLAADDRGRVPVFTPEGKLISQDGRHLTPAGAVWLADRLFRHPALAHLPPDYSPKSE